MIQTLLGIIASSGGGIDEYTKVLLHMNGTDGATAFTDETGRTWTANGNAQLDTAQKKFGAASGLFDGTGDYIDTPDSEDFNVGSGDFTVDFWVKRISTGALQLVCGQADSAAFGTTRSVYVSFTSTDEVESRIYSDGTAYTATSSTKITDSNWHHIAIVRYGNTITNYVDGTASGTVSVTGVTVNNSSNMFSIGRLGEYSSFYFNG